jgi:molecular chaperone HtpG
LNVSRSFLQQDPKVRKISSFITRKIADRLVQLVDEDREKYIKMWENISPYIKLAAIRDAKFNKKVKDAILFQKSDKTDWISIDSLLEKDYGENWSEEKDTEHHVYYGVYGETLQSLINLYKDSSKTIIMGEPPIDSHFFNFCESNYSDQKVKFKRIDSELGNELIAENPQELVDSQGNTSKDRILTRVKSILQDVEIEGEWLKNQEIPMVLIFPEFERRFREMTAAMGNTDNQLFKHKCFINLNHDLIARLDPGHKNSLSKELAENAVNHIYTLALLPHKTLKDESLDNLFVNAGRLFAKLGGISSNQGKQQKTNTNNKDKKQEKTASKVKKGKKTTDKKKQKAKAENSRIKT